MRIAIIDDLVNPPLFNIGELAFDMQIDTDGSIVPCLELYGAEITHGTICAGIIKKYSRDAEIGCIRILDNSMKGKPSGLAAAIVWCADPQNRVSLVNISAGSKSLLDYDIIAQAIAKLLRNGTYVIAAGSNDNQYALPACMDNAIGVIAGFNNSIEPSTPKYPGFPELCAPSEHDLQISVDDDKNYLTQFSNSYAAPYVTALACNYLRFNRGAKLPELRIALGMPAAIAGRTFSTDFMVSPLVMDLSGGDNLDALNKLQHLPKLDFNHSNLNGNCDLIIVPNLSGHMADIPYDWLDDEQSYLRSIVYAGTMPEKLKAFCQDKWHCQWWDEASYYDQLSQIPLYKDDVSIPIVTIYGQSEMSSDLLTDLKNRFYDNEYACGVFSDNKYAYLCGHNYIPSESEQSKAIILYYSKSYDVILLLSSNPDIHSFSDEDVCVWLTDDNVSVVSNMSDKSIIVHDVNNDTESLFQDILRWYGKQ